MNPLSQSVPYSLEECSRRIEALDEAPPGFIEARSPAYMGKLYSNWGERSYRTVVKCVSQDEQSAIYNLRRIPRQARFLVLDYTAQITVTLQMETAHQTGLTLQNTTWGVIKLALLIIGFIIGMLMVIFLFSPIFVMLPIAGVLINFGISQWQGKLLDRQIQASLSASSEYPLAQ